MTIQLGNVNPAESGSADRRRLFDLSKLGLRYEGIVDAKTGATNGLQVLLTGAEGCSIPHAWANQGWNAVQGSGRVDEQVLRIACAQLKAWRREGFEISLCVPISSKSLAQPGVADAWLAVMRNAEVNPRCVNFGITPLSGDRGPAVASNMAKLAEAGASFSLLGFGTGYSSLAQLKAIPFARLEVCEEYVRDLGSDDDGAAIVRSTLAMAKGLGLRTSLAGVVSLDVARKGAGLGADELRGSWSSAPSPAEQVREQGMLRHVDVSSMSVLQSFF